MNKIELIALLRVVEKDFAVQLRDKHHILFDEYELEETIAMLEERNKIEYKIQLENILKWGGTKEEQLAAFITLIDDILSEN